MTFEEGFKQAMRELGSSEAEITEGMKRVNLIMALPQTGEIPPGNERQFIEYIKSISAHTLARLALNPEKTLNDIAEFSAKKTSLN